MTTITVYGSLIDLEQRQKHSSLFADAHPVVVRGYRRVFAQEPSWRKGNNEHRAVLTVVRSDHDFFNGLLVKLRAESDFCKLDNRERGYERIAIASSQIACLVDISRSTSLELARLQLAGEQTYLYVGKPEKKNNNILPNKDYLEICLRGAKYYGKTFYEQFLQTTYVGEVTLKTFLQRNI